MGMASNSPRWVRCNSSKPPCFKACTHSHSPVQVGLSARSETQPEPHIREVRIRPHWRHKACPGAVHEACRGFPPSKALLTPALLTPAPECAWAHQWHDHPSTQHIHTLLPCMHQRGPAQPLITLCTSHHASPHMLQPQALRAFPSAHAPQAAQTNHHLPSPPSASIHEQPCARYSPSTYAPLTHSAPHKCATRMPRCSASRISTTLPASARPLPSIPRRWLQCWRCGPGVLRRTLRCQTGSRSGEALPVQEVRI